MPPSHDRAAPRPAPPHLRPRRRPLLRTYGPVVVLWSGLIAYAAGWGAAGLLAVRAVLP